MRRLFGIVLVAGLAAGLSGCGLAGASGKAPRITAIAAGDFHSLALAGDGPAWAWGANGDGELGNGNDADNTHPVRVSGLP